MTDADALIARLPQMSRKLLTIGGFTAAELIHIAAGIDEAATMLAALRAERDHAVSVLGDYRGSFTHQKERAETAERKCDALARDAERMEGALQQIIQWSEAYPLDVFPLPDFPKAAEVLKAAGMTLDSISAANMRHVVEGVGKIALAARATVSGKDKEGQT